MRSCTRKRFASVASRRRSAFSLRRRNLRTPAASSIMARRSSARAVRTASICPWLMMTCCWRPTPASDKSSCTSRRRHSTPLMAYSESPLRNNVRDTVISVNSSGKRPDVLSRVSMTSARPNAERFEVPLKMTSSIFWLRTELGACAPRTHAMASTTFDLPDPLGPTTTVTPGSISITVESAKDLKPLRVRDFKNTANQTVIDRWGKRPMPPISGSEDKNWWSALQQPLFEWKFFHR